jgi:hypothetical protein
MIHHKQRWMERDIHQPSIALKNWSSSAGIISYHLNPTNELSLVVVT